MFPRPPSALIDSDDAFGRSSRIRQPLTREFVRSFSNNPTPSQSNIVNVATLNRLHFSSDTPAGAARVCDRVNPVRVQSEQSRKMMSFAVVGFSSPRYRGLRSKLFAPTV